jgi:hypothetical protein
MKKIVLGGVAAVMVIIAIVSASHHRVQYVQPVPIQVKTLDIVLI